MREMGRPRSNDPAGFLGLRLPRSLLHALDDARGERSRTDVVREAIERWLEPRVARTAIRSITMESIPDHMQEVMRQLDARGMTAAPKGLNQLKVRRSDGSEFETLVKYRSTQNTAPVVSGGITRAEDGTYIGIENIRNKLIPNAFTIGFVPRGVYILPHNLLIPELENWISHRRGKYHTFELNDASARQIDIDLNRYLNAWELLDG